MNGPSKFLTARKILPARARKKIEVLGMLANARKDHSSPLIYSHATVVHLSHTA